MTCEWVLHDSRCGGGDVSHTQTPNLISQHVVLRAQRRPPQQHARRRPLQVCPGARADGRACEARWRCSAQQHSHRAAHARMHARTRADAHTRARSRARRTRSHTRARTAGPATTGAADPTAGNPPRAVLVRARRRIVLGRTTTEAGTGREIAAVSWQSVTWNVALATTATGTGTGACTYIHTRMRASTRMQIQCTQPTYISTHTRMRANTHMQI